MRDRYTSATRTDKWRFDGSAWKLASVHIDGGHADTDSVDGGFRIVAGSLERSAVPNGHPATREILDRISAIASTATATVRSHRRTTEHGDVRDESVSETISISIHSPRELSFTLPCDRAVAAVEPLLGLAVSARRIDFDPRAYPVVWRNGAGSILLHEAVGHPSELAPDRLHWPAWIEVADDPQAPGIGNLPVDDVGCPTVRRVLSSGEQPSAHRRSSYRDVPLRRLTNVVVRHDDDPFDEPQARIEVFLVGRGHYDAHRDRVELRVDVADLVTNGERIPLVPFPFVEQRRDIALRIRGARGEPVEYPGVICSREGQRIAVGSFAPDILTDAFAQ